MLPVVRALNCAIKAPDLDSVRAEGLGLTVCCRCARVLAQAHGVDVVAAAPPENINALLDAVVEVRPNTLP